MVHRLVEFDGAWQGMKDERVTRVRVLGLDAQDREIGAHRSPPSHREFEFCVQLNACTAMAWNYVGAGGSRDRLAQVLARSADGFLPSIAQESQHRFDFRAHVSRWEMASSGPHRSHAGSACRGLSPARGQWGWQTGPHR